MGDQLFPLERSWYVGNTIFAILYGIQICMFFMSTYFLWTNPKTDKTRYVYIGCSAALLVLITVAMSANLYYREQMWINHRDFEGGPAAYFGTHISDWYNTFGTAADVTANVLGDELMLCRCYVFWGSISIWTVAFPALLFLGSASERRHLHGTAVNFGIPWLVLTIVFNILVTDMIGFRLISLSRSMRNVLSKERADVYVGITAILVESAAPFTLLGIAYLVTYIRNDPEVLAFADVWGMFCALSPQMIILRV
ncbi:hypothetical protein C8J57DRAFT_1622009, partial [Mycena rebaudengoi]